MADLSDSINDFLGIAARHRHCWDTERLIADNMIQKFEKILFSRTILKRPTNVGLFNIDQPVVVPFT